jgi:TatD DNase family protein
VALGEIGLDAWHGTADLDAQVDLFSRQLLLARDLNLPVIIHARKTQDLVLQLVRQTGFQCGGIMHAFSGSEQQAQRAVDMGFLIGFGGAATYERARKLRAMLRTLPANAIVFETDAPDIPPCFQQGQRNTPLNLIRIVSLLAEVMERPVEQVWQQSTDNVERLLMGVSSGQ